MAAGDLVMMVNGQTITHFDACQVLAYTTAQDDHGNMAATYTAANSIACGYQQVRPRDEQEMTEVPVIDAILRLPLTTDLDERDHIRMVTRYGTALDDAMTYEIEGPVKRGPSGLVVDLRLVDDGS